MRYKLIDHTADVMVSCKGKDLEECFENAAYALFDQMVDATTIKGSVIKEIISKGHDDEEKLYSFLSELLFVMETEGLVFNDFKVAFTDDAVKCIAKGESLDLGRHNPKTEVKAITYHELKVDHNVPCVTVIFDV